MRHIYKCAFAAALMAGVAFSAIHVFAADEPAAAPQGPMPVSVAVVGEKDITRWGEFSGRLRAVDDVQVRPRVSGTIDEVHFTEGDMVKKGDKLFTIDLRPYKAAYDQAEAAQAAAKAQADLADSDMTRAQKLFNEKAFSQREFDQRSNAAKSADANVKAADAALELASLNLDYAEIKSPIDGRVGRPDITVGNIVQAGPGAAVLTTIQSVNPIYADFDIDEQTYLRAKKSVQEGKAADMPVFMALADETDFKREGKIRSFDNQLSGDSGTMRVRAEFENTDGLLTPGLFAHIRLGNADRASAVLVNDSAISTDQDRKFVYAVDDKGNVSYRPVVLGGLNDGMRVIDQGLKAGEKIVVNGLMRVHPGMQVQPVMVAMDTLKPAGAPADGAAPTDAAKPTEDKAPEDKDTGDKK